MFTVRPDLGITYISKTGDLDTHGWSVSILQKKDINDAQLAVFAANCLLESFYGYKNNGDLVEKLKWEFAETGSINITFGNCGIKGDVVLIFGSEQYKASSNKYITAALRFVKGNVLEIRRGAGLIALRDVTFLQGG